MKGFSLSSVGIVASMTIIPALLLLMTPTQADAFALSVDAGLIGQDQSPPAHPVHSEHGRSQNTRNRPVGDRKTMPLWSLMRS